MTDPITLKIQELVPEIMELKFGCELYRKGATKRELFVGQFADTISLIRLDDSGTWLPFEIPKPPASQAYEILGRPITLADVLREIETTYERKVRNVKLASFAELNDMEQEQLSIIRRWNLTTDYDNQTQEVKDFIGSLIGVTN